VLYAKHIVKHFFNVEVSSVDELISYWNAYRRFKTEENNALTKVVAK
jgi:hypothetical protein